ncbi:MAG TPA: aspartyl/asparaginyl beta-hydroxylase domain-containing protein [Tahibacter sp.]|uniref:aspartyl/asparaginyl beta-hydroxylase domain-containing protein n=1 Tax=Tahibacter sp. TaxID=2056211 RepID=UPI002BB0024B|nr:aspartyl/asparaginyl beta-hydroxylase domain-containing protein [Tahibacter sp.]HSX59302.1 aspartyl/asparaginyl beta-hydroxylase domain-containing protein [Tahibacter sp.]
MKLQYPFLQLPLSFDANALAAEIGALGESVWRPHPQGFPGNSALPLIATNGDPGNDDVRGRMQPTPHLEKLPYLREVLGSLGAVFGRSRLMRLSGQAEVTPHVDIDYYWRDHIRVHVPIVTQPEVTFYCGSQQVHMAAGECWIFDTWSTHKVVNSAERARIHLVADTVGGAEFWQLVSRSRVPGHPAAWTPTRIAPGSTRPVLRIESTNVPTVMTPWELREQLTFILDETRPDPRIGQLHQLASGLGREWRALWALHGESENGWADYRALMSRFMRDIETTAQGLRLHNGVPVTNAILSLVSSVAVADDPAAIKADERSGVAV